MPDRAVGLERWRALGRLLPQDVRERVFEPAFGDLMHNRLTTAEDRPRLPFGITALGTYLACFPIAIPRLFVKGGRLTSVGRASVWAVAVLATVALVMANMSPSVPPYSP